MNGFSILRAQKATKKPRSQPAASIPMNYRAERWRAGEYRDCFLSAKSLMSPAIWAASIFNGHGPRELRLAASPSGESPGRPGSKLARRGRCVARGYKIITMQCLHQRRLLHPPRLHLGFGHGGRGDKGP